MEAAPFRRSAIRFVVAAFLVGLLALAPSASGALIDLSDESRSRDPAIAVDGDGTAHVVWNVSILGADDDLVYCRIPRGAGGCDRVHRFSLAGEDFSGPKVVITANDEIVLTTGRCCFPPAPVRALVSTDGGESFGSPVTIASEFSVINEVAPGPGDFSVSLSGGNSGPDYSSIWRAAPLDGSSPSAKVLLSPFPKAYTVSTGFPDPNSPLVAYSDLHNVYFRQWDGTGDHNSVSNWLPEGPPVASGDEPKLASGIKGVYLIYLGSQPPYQYYVRSFDGTGFPAFTERVVSLPKTGQSAIFRDFYEDGQGNLHAVFAQQTKGGEWRLQHRVSRDGNRSWEDPATLVNEGPVNDLFNLRVGAAADGGGGVVGDDNGGGRIWFAPFRPLSNPPGTCKPFVKLGQTRVLALKGCFKKQKGKKAWVASGPVKVNGIDIEPKGGGASASRAKAPGANTSAGFKVTANPGNRTLKTNKAARVRAGAVLLDIGPVNWKLPAKDGKVVKLGTGDGSAFKNLGKFTKELFDLKVVGDAELKIKGTGTEIPSHFKMPGILGGVTGNTTFATNQKIGFDTKDLKIDVPKATVGLLRLAGIDIDYDGADGFTGTARIALPPQYSQEIVEVTLGIKDGELDLLKVVPPAFKPPLPIVGSPPTPLVGLDRIDFAYIRAPDSRLFEGGVYLIGGSKLLGLQLDGKISLKFPNSGPTTLSAGGVLKVATPLTTIPLGNGSAVYTVGFPGSLKFNGSFSVYGISGSVDGFVDLKSGKFSAAGKASWHGLGGEAVLSSKGVAACVSVPGPPPDVGFGWKWGDVLPSGPLCPDVGSYKVAATSSRNSASGADAMVSATGADLPGGLREAAIAVLGIGGAPDISVTGPDGQTVASGATVVETGSYRITKVPAESRTVVQIGAPPGGNYSIDTQPGSVPIDRVLTARSLPEPKVTAKVKGKKRNRRINFKIRKIAGQRVSFAEQASGVYRELKITKKAGGSFRFSPAPGPAGRRRIVALVEQNGLPRTKLTVARYRAPGTAKTKRPKRARAIRRGKKLVVKWKKVRGAHGYEVRVNLPRDGRRLLFFPGRKKTRIKIGGIERTDKARITIAGIGADVRPGRKAVTKLKPKKNRKHRKRRGRR